MKRLQTGLLQLPREGDYRINLKNCLVVMGTVTEITLLFVVRAWVTVDQPFDPPGLVVPCNVKPPAEAGQDRITLAPDCATESFGGPVTSSVI